MNNKQTTDVSREGAPDMSLSRLVYVSTSLFIVNYLLSIAFSIFIARQVSLNPNGWGTQVLVHSSALIAAGFFLEMLVIDLFYLGLRSRKSGTALASGIGLSLKDFRLAAAAGMLASLVAVPAALLFKPAFNPMNLFLQCPICVAGVSLCFFYLIGIPVVAEIFFRGIFLKGTFVSLNAGAAILVSALYFAAVWPLFNPLVGMILGVASGVTYVRTQNVLACSIVNALVSASCGAFLVLRAMGLLG